MDFGPDKIWLIPLLPLLAAGIIALARGNRLVANLGAIGAIGVSCVLSILAFVSTLSQHGAHRTWNFRWLDVGPETLKLGFLLDPLTAAMLVMVTFIGLLIFVYSVGYMAQDENYTTFFCFLSLFAAGMLGLVVANSLLLFFICWEIVGLASYLLIGFWYFKPSAAAAAKKAFITTRIGDLGLFLGMLWLYQESGTLLFYDDGRGCLEGFVGASTAISLLIFCGAVGKSGQVPLHVWLPDAMEGPTPVSALIHAATMVAAGVFLVARVYPIMDADPANVPGISTALSVVTWVGAITAVFAALIAVAQTDIKRILAYSTVSQLGYMMVGLGTGGVAVGMFHLITHAFFKALLFLGAGSVIHGAHHEQEITRMGGFRKLMPVTFATYAIGMMALTGVPLFSGFWSKDEILHAAFEWDISKGPLLLGLFGAFLTAFYMMRQVIYVFFGEPRSKHQAHESPSVMTVPLIVLAACAILIGFIGTPAWPWFEAYLQGHDADFNLGKLFAGSVLFLMAFSTIVVALGLGLGWWIYGKKRFSGQISADPLNVAQPALFRVLQNRFYIDEIYNATLVRFTELLALAAGSVERAFFSSIGKITALAVFAFAWINRCLDLFVIDKGFDQSCRGLTKGADSLRKTQSGFSQDYLRAIAVAVTVLVLVLVWGALR